MNIQCMYTQQCGVTLVCGYSQINYWISPLQPYSKIYSITVLREDNPDKCLVSRIQLRCWLTTFLWHHHACVISNPCQRPRRTQTWLTLDFIFPILIFLPPLSFLSLTRCVDLTAPAAEWRCWEGKVKWWTIEAHI